MDVAMEAREAVWRRLAWLASGLVYALARVAVGRPRAPTSRKKAVRVVMAIRWPSLLHSVRSRSYQRTWSRRCHARRMGREGRGGKGRKRWRAEAARSV